MLFRSPHNADAETVRDAPGSQILQTVEPFSSRDDALKAEAVAIHVAMLSGVVLVALADVLGRTLIAPAQVPAGLMVPLIGAPYLVWLLWRSRVG